MIYKHALVSSSFWSFLIVPTEHHWRAASAFTERIKTGGCLIIIDRDVVAGSPRLNTGWVNLFVAH
jgi:hypothetical protein